MIMELTQRQKEICDYAEEHGRSAASEHFGISASKVSYITQKRRRLDEQSRTQEKGFVMIGLGQNAPCTNPPVPSDSVSFTIGRTKIEMSVADFRKAFLYD